MSKSIKNILCVLFAAALSFVILAAGDRYSAKISEKTAQNEQNAELLAVMPDGEDFEKLDIADAKLPETVDEVYEESSGGYVIRLTVTGYAPDMVILCGIDSSGRVTGAECISSNETLGREKTYGESTVGTTLATVDSLSTVAGATKTTKGYKKAIEDALVAYGALSGGN